ncbi:MAG: glucosyltransferase domain-containing protein [Oscillospiraceae bacterium]|nr:glucosyltransferase domain-containing protein [Oscillospiraceae bacterium]
MADIYERNEKLKLSKKELITFIIIFAFSLIIFCQFLTGHNSTDNYVIMENGYHTYALNWSLVGGRVFMCVICLIAGVFNIPNTVFVVSTLVIGLFISCIAVIVLKNIVLKYKPAKNKYHEWLVLLISFVTIFNFMYLEDMYFAECIVMSLSILLYMLAAKRLVYGGKHSVLKSLGLFILAVFSYQGTVGIFFALVVLFSIIKSVGESSTSDKTSFGSNKNRFYPYISNVIKGIAIMGIGILVNIFQVKLTNFLLNTVQGRVGTISQIPQNIAFIIRNISEILKNTCDLFPKWLFIIFLICVVLVALFYFIKNKVAKKQILLLFTIIIITILSSFILFVMTTSSFYGGRMHFCIGAVFGIVLIFLYCNTNTFDTKFKYIIVTMLSCYFVVTMCMYVYFMYQHKLINELERTEVLKINDYIEQYEKENNTTIESVIIYYVPAETDKAYRDNEIFKNTYNMEGTKAYWDVIYVINYYTGRNLKQIGAQILDSSIFPEGYECDGNILYINAYMN